MHVVVLGHVDAGKSTLMGRVLHAVGAVDAKQQRRNERDAAAMGKASFGWAFALDATEEERSRGVTVDVAQARFVTPGNARAHEPTRVTLLDAPGHRDFVGNAISGAARADAAVLVVDASAGGFEAGFREAAGANGRGGYEASTFPNAGRKLGGVVGTGQTREHVRLARSLGVNRVVVAVSKMDSCEYSRDRFDEIKNALTPFLAQSGFDDGRVSWVPVSGFEGVNLVPNGRRPGPAIAGAVVDRRNAHGGHRRVARRRPRRSPARFACRSPTSSSATPARTAAAAPRTARWARAPWGVRWRPGRFARVTRCWSCPRG